VFIDGAPVDAVARLRYVMLPAGQSPVMPLLAGNGTVSTYPATWPGPPGQFVLRNVSGVIVLRHAGSPGLSLRNVVSNGIDVTGGFEVTQSDVTVEVHLTAFGGVLKGVVKDAGGAPASESDVVLFSADPSHWQVPLSRRMATVRTNDKGAFEVTGLPAGEYVAVAVPDLDRAMWADPVRLERLRPFATPFSVSDGATATIALAVKR
jgi:hypothetical protein